MLKEPHSSGDLATAEERACNEFFLAIHDGDDEKVTAAVSSGGIATLIKTYTAYKSDERAFQSALKTTTALCLHKGEYREHLGKEGAIEALVSIMEDGGCSDEIKLSCMSSLVIICKGNKANCQRMASKGVELVVSIMAKLHTTTGAPDMVRAWLADCSEMLYSVASKRGVEAMIVTAMSKYMQNVEVQKAASLVLIRIVQLNANGFAGNILEKGGVQLLVKAMSMHEKDTDFQVSGFVVLSKMLLLQERRLQAEIEQKGGVKAVFRAFNLLAAQAAERYKSEEDKASLVNGVKCVHQLLEHTVVNIQEASSEGCIAAVGKIMSTDTKNVKLQEQCIILLQALVMASHQSFLEQNCQRVVQAGLITLMAEVLNTFPKEANIVEGICWVGNTMICCHARYRTAWMEAVPAVIQALKQSANNADPSAPMVCCLLLYTLCMGPDMKQFLNIFAKQGVVRVVMDMIHKHKDNLETISQGLALIGNISDFKNGTFSVIEHRDVDLVLSVMRKSLRNLMLQLMIICFLQSCCKFSADLQGYIGDVGGHEVVFQSMEIHASEFQLSQAGMVLMGRFASSNTKNKDRIGDKGLKLLARIVNQHGKNDANFLVIASTVFGEIADKHPANTATLQTLAPNIPCKTSPSLETLMGFTGFDGLQAEVGSLQDMSFATEEEKRRVMTQCADRTVQSDMRRRHESCVMCGKTAFEAAREVLLKCSGCTLAPIYCSADCQKAAWPQHKAE